jgi:hypothetical protein
VRGLPSRLLMAYVISWALFFRADRSATPALSVDGTVQAELLGYDLLRGASAYAHSDLIGYLLAVVSAIPRSARRSG